MKTEQELCTDYIEKLIKKHKMYEPDILTAILKKYNYELNINTLTSLSNYYDKLESLVDEDSEFNYLMAERYGYTKEYFEKQDIAVEGLREVLEITYPEEMEQLRSNR